MTDIGAIQAAISSLKVATDLTKGILETKNAIEVQGKVIALQSALLDAHTAALGATTAQFELQDRVRELERRLKDVDDWGPQERRYALVGPWRGAAQVYALRREQANGETAHYLCTNCFHSRRRVILNPVVAKDGFVSVSCPVCRASMDTGYRGIGAPKYVEDINND